MLFSSEIYNCGSVKKNMRMIFDIKRACVILNMTRDFISQIWKHPANHVLDQCLLKIMSNWTAQVVLVIKCRFQKLDINAFVYQRTGTKWMPLFGPLVGLVSGSETPKTNCPKHETKRLKSYFVPEMHY